MRVSFTRLYVHVRMCVSERVSTSRSAADAFPRITLIPLSVVGGAATAN